ncbi:prolyl 4-hydroxylase subunit alpha-2-like [Portunus trituberculatus]|uniref:prolyl 4-hydroxylase subunit alpha-2-like n=1 Tax=Portunus trituberculatus TaxID=210409 RepID=UPI001E1CDF9C|nr:prolyl 4-hydroxylase subunit alpha-2-like [Portunus trituberculatus]
MSGEERGWWVLVVMVSVAASGYTQGLGDVHTSAASVARLVEAEQAVVAALQDYVTKEDARLEVIRRYVESWRGSAADYVHNPINSYFFMRRLTQDFLPVQDALHPPSTADLHENMSSLRGNLNLPEETDLNGVAFALVRLQDTYNLTVDDLVEGDIRGRKAVQVLSADDCFRLGQQSFNNLEFDLSEQWYRKGLELLANQQPLTREEQTRIERVSRQQEHRVLMSKMVTEMARHSNSEMLDNFSGLGIPISFQQEIYANHKGAEAVKRLDDLYRRLCRGEQIQSPEAFIGMKCGYVFGGSAYHRLMPFKAELRWADPIIVVYHDVLTEAETEAVKQLSLPRLATTMVHSFTTHQIRKSLARVGKTAWVKRGDDPVVDKILQRIEYMTGLSTLTSEDLHVLNYGIGGHYDAHVDFFDLEEKSLDKTPHQGDRLATMLFYLNDVEAGGSTVFPTLGVEVAARRGSALFWFNLKRNGRGDYRTVHASCPVLLGEKWIANLWLHEWGQEFRWSCTLDPEE